MQDIGRRIVIDGESYPLTGYWCHLCGIPRIPLGGLTVHPNCFYQHQDLTQEDS